MLANSKQDDLSVVILGDFNPAIIQPSWLAIYGLIKTNESEEAAIDVIAPDVSAFGIGDWLRIEALRDRLKISTTNEAYYESIRDIMIGIITLLCHTPLKAIGINLSAIYKYRDQKYSTLVDSAFTNKESLKNIHKNAHLSSSIITYPRDDAYNGYIKATIKNDSNSDDLMISVNDHYEFYETDKTTPYNTLIGLLNDKWYNSIDNCNKVIDKINKMIRYESL